MIKTNQISTCASASSKLEEMYQELRKLEQKLYLAGLHDQGLKLSILANQLCAESMKLDSLARNAFVAARNGKLGAANDSSERFIRSELDGELK